MPNPPYKSGALGKLGSAYYADHLRRHAAETKNEFFSECAEELERLERNIQTLLEDNQRYRTIERQQLDTDAASRFDRKPTR